MNLHTLRGAARAALLLGVGALTACASAQQATGRGSSDGASPSYQYMPATGNAVASQRFFDPLSSSLADNQTIGFGKSQQLVFTYQQQFDCVVQPNDDRNFSGTPADLDPQQFASPECQVGYPSTIDPTGKSVKKTDPLYVMLPFFETDKKAKAFSPALGKALKKLFGFVPDAFKTDPGVPVQCPAPKDKPATCTMHPLMTDVGPLLTALGLEPKDTNLYVPLANHDHLLNNMTVNQSPEWWQVIIVLVEDPSQWPDATGKTGITSLAKLRAAQKAKQASGDVPTNFFLFFSSKSMGMDMRR